MEENYKVTDPEILKKLEEEARFINNLMDLGELSEQRKIQETQEIKESISNEIIDNNPTVNVDLVVNRQGEYVPYNDSMVYIEHRGYYVEENECYWLDFQHIDEDIDMVIPVLDFNGEMIEVSKDYKELILTTDGFYFISKQAAINNKYEFVNNQWIKKVIDFGLDKTKLKFYDEMEEVLNKFYPGLWWYQKVDYTFDFELPSRYSMLSNIFGSSSSPRSYPNVLIIKFPYIKITNSDNQEHIIEDLYIVSRSNDRGQFTGLFGFRGKITNVEAINRYYHSHLPNGSYSEIGNFCLGSGPLGVIMQTLRDKEFSKDFFSYFLVNLKVYVEWESIEGGPYRRMKENLDRQVVTINDREDNSQILKPLETLLKNGSLTGLIEYNSSKKLLDINFKKLENILCESNLMKDFLVFYKDEDLDEYFSIRQESRNNTPSFNQPLCKLGDKEIFMEVKKNESNSNKVNYKKVLHPNIVIYAKKYLSRRINEYYFQENKN